MRVHFYGVMALSLGLLVQPKPGFGINITDYWDRTELKFSSLRDPVNNDTCYKKDEFKVFRGCLAAIQSIWHLNEPAWGLELAEEVKAHPIAVYKKFGPFLLVPRSQIPDFQKMDIGNYNRWQAERTTSLKLLKKIYDAGMSDAHKRVDFEFMLRWAETMSAKFASEAYMTAEGLNAFLNVVIDPHTHYYPRDLYEEETQSGKVGLKNLILQHGIDAKPTKAAGELGSFYGIGISLKQEGGGFSVKAVNENGPAENAGIQVDDVLLEVDGRVLKTKSYSDVLSLIRGEKGTSVKIKVLRHQQEHTFEIPRAEIVIRLIQTQNFKFKDFPITYLRIADFEKANMCLKLKETLEEIEAAKKSQALIVDLRNNPGGLVNQATCAASLFLGGGSVIMTSRDPKTNKVLSVETSYYSKKYPDTSPLTRLPVYLLQNNLSASAAEIFAGALRDYRRAFIVGETSFGKGTVQANTITDIQNPLMLFMTKWRFHQPSGSSNQLSGIPSQFVVHEQWKDSDSAANIVRERNLFDEDAIEANGVYREPRLDEIHALDKCVTSQAGFDSTDLYVQKAEAVAYCHHNQITGKEAEKEQSEWASDDDSSALGAAIFLGDGDKEKVQKVEPLIHALAKTGRKIPTEKVAYLLTGITYNAPRLELLSLLKTVMAIEKTQPHLVDIVATFYDSPEKWQAAEVLLK